MANYWREAKTILKDTKLFSASKILHRYDRR